MALDKDGLVIPSGKPTGRNRPLGFNVRADVGDTVVEKSEITAELLKLSAKGGRPRTIKRVNGVLPKRTRKTRERSKAVRGAKLRQLARITRFVSLVYGVSEAAVRGRSKDIKAKTAREALYYLGVRHSGCKFNTIAQYCSNRRAPSVQQGYNKIVKNRLERNK